MRKTLGDVFRDLSYGNLSNLAIGGEGKGAIPETHQERILALVNQGVTKLSGRFVVREESLLLRATKDQLEYDLIPERADSNLDAGSKYIIDTAQDPFDEEIMNVLIVIDENGDELVIDNREVSGSVMVKGTHLKFSEVDEDEVFEIIYQPKPKLLESVEASQPIILPEALYEALEAYVGYRVMAPMNGVEHKVRSDDLKMTFEMICNDALDKGLVRLSVTGSNAKLGYRGFV